MRNLIISSTISLLLCLFVLGLSNSQVATAGEVTIQWFGQACFLVTSSNGTKVLMDPFSKRIGYDFPTVAPDIVTVSHEHFDHNNVRSVRGRPEILRGLTSNEKDWNQIKWKAKDVEIYTVPAYHDNVRGRKRGLNTIFVLTVDGIRIAHLGDLGHLLTSEQVRKIGKIDVLLIPVGGVYTIDGRNATKVVEQLDPKIVIPMHYKTPDLKIKLETAERFLRGKRGVERRRGNTERIDRENLPKTRKIIVLGYKW